MFYSRPSNISSELKRLKQLNILSYLLFSIKTQIAVVTKWVYPLYVKIIVAFANMMVVITTNGYIKDPFFDFLIKPAQS